MPFPFIPVSLIKAGCLLNGITACHPGVSVTVTLTPCRSHTGHPSGSAVGGVPPAHPRQGLLQALPPLLGGPALHLAVASLLEASAWMFSPWGGFP